MINVNCIDMLQGLKNIPNDFVDCLVTDPPYKIVQGGCTKALGEILGKNKPLGGVLKGRNRQEVSDSELQNVKEGKLFDFNSITFAEWMPEVYRVLKPKSHAYIFISGRRLNELTNEALKAGFIYQNLLVWKKQNAVPNKWYMNQCEFILMLRKGGAKNINDMGSTTCLEFNNILRTKTHPTEKPVDLLEHLICNSTKHDEIVLDPFMGTGSTGVACLKTHRNFIGFEIDSKFYDIAIKRFEITK